MVPRCHSERRICSRCPRPRDPASQTPDERIKSLKAEIKSLRRHLGEAMTQLEIQEAQNKELQEELAALKENNFEGKINTSEEKGRKKSEAEEEVEQLDSPPKERKRTAKGRKKRE